MADGWITIGTELSTDKFDRQIVGLEKKMKKEEDKKLVIETKLSGQEQDLTKEREQLKQLEKDYDYLVEMKIKASKTPTEFTNMQNLEQQYGSIEKLETALDKATSKVGTMESKVAQTKLQYDGVVAKVDEYRQKVEGIKLQKQQADVQKLKDGFGGVGSNIEKAIKKTSRLILGIFGIRSAFMFLRRASSDLANYDSQYATNLEYIRYVLTMAIAPVLRWIVNMAMQLLQLINMIINALFGVNIFASGSAENFQKMKQGAAGVSGAVKEIKKQLLGFDEINVLTEDSDTGTAGRSRRSRNA